MSSIHPIEIAKWASHEIDEVEGHFVVFGPADNQLLRDETNTTRAVRPLIKEVQA